MLEHRNNPNIVSNLFWYNIYYYTNKLNSLNKLVYQCAKLVLNINLEFYLDYKRKMGIYKRSKIGCSIA